jgi:hypothetical protein
VEVLAEAVSDFTGEEQLLVDRDDSSITQIRRDNLLQYEHPRSCVTASLRGRWTRYSPHGSRRPRW